jgi:hypothetical protein
MGSALAAALALAATSCAQLRGGDDQAVRLRLANSGTLPLHCRLHFAHWVEHDLGAIAPGHAIEVAMRQAAGDGALYIPRSDGQRLMMIETVVCGRDGDWMASFGQVDLAPLRVHRPMRATVNCAASMALGRVVCSAPVFPQ